MSNKGFTAPDGGRSPRVGSPAPLHTATRLGIVEHTDVGNGPAVLALHGGMGGYDQSLILAEALFGKAEGMRVIALSRPGYLGTPLEAGVSLCFHASTGSRKPATFQVDASAAEAADLYAALLDALGIARAVVVAVSAGGPSAVAFAARHPERCAGLILVSAASGRFDVPAYVLKRLRWFRWLVRVPGLPSLMAWQMGRHPEKAAARAIGDPGQVRRTLDHPEAGPLFAALFDSTSRQLAARLPGTVADTMGFADLPPLPFDKVEAPTLVIHGDADQVVPFSHGERSAREIAGAELHVVSGGQHVSLFTHLDEVRERARAFLRRIEL